MTGGGRRSPARRRLAGLAIAVAIVGMGGWIAWRIVAPDLVARVITTTLAARGVVVDRLEVTDLTPYRLRIEDVVLSGDLVGGRIGAVDVAFDPISLARTGRLRRVAIRDADLAATLDSDRLSAPDAAADGQGIVLPADEIAVEESRLHISSPWLEAVVYARGTATQDTDGRLAADIDIGAEALVGAGWELRRIDGWVSVTADPGTHPSLRGQLAAERGRAGALETAAPVVQLGGDDGRYWGLLRIPFSGRGGLRVDLAVADGVAHAETDIAADDLASLAAAAGDPAITGMAELLATVEVPLDTLAAWPEALPAADGALRLRLHDVAVGDRLRGVSGLVEGDLEVRDGIAGLSGGAPWTLTAEAGRLGRAALTLAGPELTFDPAAQGMLRLAADYAATVGPADGSGVVAAAVGLRGGHVAVERLTLRVPPTRLQGIEGEIRSLAVSGEGTAESFAGRFAIEAAASGLFPGNVKVDGGTIEAAGAVVGGDGALRFVPDGCVAIGAASLTVAGEVSVPEGVRLCAAAPPKRPLATLAVGDAPELSVDFATTAVDVALALPGGSATATVPALDAGLRYGPGTGLVLDGRASGGRLAMASPPLVLDGIGASISARAAAEVQATAEWRVEAAAPGGDPAPVVPLRVVGTATAEAGGVMFRGTAIGGRGGLMAAFEGHHEGRSGGRVDVRVDPVTFAPGIRQPADLFPVAAALDLGEVAGAVSARMRYGWGGRAGSSARIAIDDLSMVTGGIAAAGISARLDASSLAPLVLPPDQRLTVRLLDVGIPLQNGVAVFGLDAARRLSVRELRLDWAGGRLSAEPFVLSLDGSEHAAVLRATGIDLAQAIAGAPVDGLEVTGRLDGRIPLRLRNDMIAVDDGVLRTTEPGVIRYTPGGRQPDGNENVALLLDALRNFHYDSLTLRLDGRTGQDMAARVEIRGSNPDLYDGYPVALNVNVSGALDQILRQGIASVGYADRVGAAMRGRLDGGLGDDFLDSIEGIQQ